MGGLLNDIRYGLRMLGKRPGITVAAILCLGLGIGVTITMFTFVNAALIRPLPYEDIDEIVWVMETAPKRGFTWLGVAWPNFHDWQEQNTAFEYLAAYQGTSLSLAGGEEPKRVQALRTSADLFRVLGYEPAAGRNFTPEDDIPGAPDVTILSHALWQGHFGADPDIVGATVTLHGIPHTVIGIMPAGMRYPEFTELWVPMSRYNGLERRGQHSLQAVGRMKDGVGAEQALADLRRVVRNLEELYPDQVEDNDVRIVPLLEFVTSDVRDQFLYLMGAVALVLLIACANVANMLLARSLGRTREIAIRGTLGAGRGRMMRQLLTESLLLALAGGLIGLGLGQAGIVLTMGLVPVEIPFYLDFSIDWRVILFLFGITVLTGITFGLAPVVQARRTDIVRALKSGGARSGGGRRHLLRNTLVVGETALSLVLLASAGLFIQSWYEMQQVDPGFEPEGILTMHLSLPGPGYPEPAQRREFFTRTLSELEALPGVESAAAVLTLPMSGSNWGNSYSVEGPEFPADEPLPVGNFRMVHGPYLETMRIPLLAGRYFTADELRQGTPVVVVNEELAHRWYPEGNALGGRLKLGRPEDEDAPWYDIVGVVSGVRHHGLDNEIQPGFYLPYALFDHENMWIVARSAADPLTVAAGVRSAIRTIDPALPIHELRTMPQVLEEWMWGMRIFMMLLGAFSFIALLLAMLGVYGVMLYATGERTREIGIRLAVGARPGRVVSLVVRQGMLLVVVGMIIGVVLSIGAGLVMTSLFTGVVALEPLPLIAVVLLMSGVGLAASLQPALRAARQDPTSALRFE